MGEHTVPSITPLNKQGWITDPQELMECHELCDMRELLIFGSYHMHTVARKDDDVRDTPHRTRHYPPKKRAVYFKSLSLCLMLNVLS